MTLLGAYKHSELPPKMFCPKPSLYQYHLKPQLNVTSACCPASLLTCMLLYAYKPDWRGKTQTPSTSAKQCKTCYYHYCAAYRYTLNWVKMRVWEQVQWDGIIMINVDVTVLGDLTHLLHLRTDFADFLETSAPANCKLCMLPTGIR